MRSVAEQVATTKNKGMLTRTCRSLLSTLLMCAANDDNKVSDGAIGRQILGSYSMSTRRRMLRKAGIKRKRFDTQDLGQFSIVDVEEKRWKYTEADIEGLRNYMIDNTYTRDSPMKDDAIYKRDYNSEYLLLSCLLSKA